MICDNIFLKTSRHCVKAELHR